MRLDCSSARFRINRYVWKVKSVRVENCAKKDWLFFYVVLYQVKWRNPLLIGKAAKPRCFWNLDIRKLPVEWRSNKKAWMTSQITEEWLTAFNGRMEMQNWHVSLFLDNATCHLHIKLSNVRLAWFPPNTTSVSQPMDQGIIRNVKVHYRKLLMQFLLANMDCTSSASELARTVSVLDAVIWISQAVKKLLPENCDKVFRKSRIFYGWSYC